MVRIPLWPPRSQNWRIVEGRAILPAAASSTMSVMLDVRSDDGHTVLPHGRADLVWGQTRSIVVECLDLFQESLPRSFELARGRPHFAERTVLPAPSKPTMMTENSSFLCRHVVVDLEIDQNEGKPGEIFVKTFEQMVHCN
jgi:hypothetical protein